MTILPLLAHPMQKSSATSGKSSIGPSLEEHLPTPVLTNPVLVPPRKNTYRRPCWRIQYWPLPGKTPTDARADDITGSAQFMTTHEYWRIQCSHRKKTKLRIKAELCLGDVAWRPHIPGRRVIWNKCTKYCVQTVSRRATSKSWQYLLLV